MVSGLPGVRLGRVAKPVGEDLSTEVEPVAIQHRQEVGKVATAHRTNQKFVTSKDAQVKKLNMKSHVPSILLNASQNYSGRSLFLLHV